MTEWPTPYTASVKVPGTDQTVLAWCWSDDSYGVWFLADFKRGEWWATEADADPGVPWKIQVSHWLPLPPSP